MTTDYNSPVVLPSFDTLLLAMDGTIATVTLNRPAVLNALNAQVFNDLERVFTFLAQNSVVRVILITGAGPKAFAAGADITELAHTDASSGDDLSLRGQHVFALIESSKRPVIACINGFALGGGCELALACTFRLAADTARLGQPEVKLGLLPGYGGTQRLPRLVGQSAALKLILTGEIIPATEALRIGLVDEIIPVSELMERGQALANTIAAHGPLAVEASIEAVQSGLALHLDEGLALEASLFGRLSHTADKHEGVQAFLEKRKPAFLGR